VGPRAGLEAEIYDVAKTKTKDKCFIDCTGYAALINWIILKEVVTTDSEAPFQHLEKLQKTVCQSNCFLDRDSNPGPPNYKTEAVATAS
jgi:hypothetical protein